VIWQVKLCCQNRAILALKLDMQVRRSTRVLTRQQCLEQKTPSATSILMTPEMVTAVVVAAPIVTLPKIEEHTWYRAAGAVHHLADELKAWRFCIGIN
jgi:hypothetical protein